MTQYHAAMEKAYQRFKERRAKKAAAATTPAAAVATAPPPAPAVPAATPSVSGSGSVNVVVAPAVDQFTGHGYVMAATPPTPPQMSLLSVNASESLEEFTFPQATVPISWFTTTALPPTAPPPQTEEMEVGFLMMTAPTSIPSPPEVSGSIPVVQFPSLGLAAQARDLTRQHDFQLKYCASKAHENLANSALVARMWDNNEPVDMSQCHAHFAGPLELIPGQTMADTGCSGSSGSTAVQHLLLNVRQPDFSVVHRHLGAVGGALFSAIVVGDLPLRHEYCDEKGNVVGFFDSLLKNFVIRDAWPQQLILYSYGEIRESTLKEGQIRIEFNDNKVTGDGFMGLTPRSGGAPQFMPIQWNQRNPWMRVYKCPLGAEAFTVDDVLPPVLFKHVPPPIPRLLPPSDHHVAQNPSTSYAGLATVDYHTGITAGIANAHAVQTRLMSSVMAHKILFH